MCKLISHTILQNYPFVVLLPCIGPGLMYFVSSYSIRVRRQDSVTGQRLLYRLAVSISVLLSSRPWSWSRVVSRPNPELSGLGLGLAFKQDQDLINFYCAISATKLWLLYITETHCPRFDMHASLDFMQSWNCICLYQWHLRRLKGCSATVAYLWGHIVPDWENLYYPTFCSWSATGTWTTRMWLHGHWTLYQLTEL